MSENAQVQPGQEQESSTIRNMRTQIGEANKEAQDAKAERDAALAKLQEIERSKLEETDRLRLEAEEFKRKAEELSPLAGKVEAYEGKFKQLFEQELAKVPESVKGQVEVLTQGGSFAERYERLVGAQGMIATLTPIQEGSRVQAPTPLGSPTPTDGGRTTEKPLDFNDAKSLSWADAFRQKMPLNMAGINTIPAVKEQPK